jgi:hypothetical protein
MTNEQLIDRVKGGHKWDLKWNYNIGRISPSEPEYSQHDWNQTLMTNINQISAQIHMVTLRGPATTIIAHVSLAPLFGTLEYYNLKTKELCGRYKVIFTFDIEEYSLYVVGDEWLDNNYIPRYKIGETQTNDEGEEETELHNVELIHISSDDVTPEEIDEHRKKLIGKIVVENLN